MMNFRKSRFHLNTPGILLFAMMLTQLPPSAHAAPQSSHIISQNPNGTYNVKKVHVLHEQELEALQLIAQHPLQQRPAIYLDPALTIYAKIKVDDLSNRQYFNHPDPEGNLITHYFGDTLGSLAQAAENLAAGYPSAASTVTAWENSTTGHRESMLGLSRNGQPNPLYPFFGIGFVKGNTTGDKYQGLYWATENSHNPGAIQGPLASPEAFAKTAEYQVLLPDGKTPVDRNWNWVTAEIAGMQRVHIENDATYTSNLVGHFQNLGGRFFIGDTLDLSYSLPIAASDEHWFFVPYQGWLWTQNQHAPFFWSKNRGNWIYVDEKRGQVFDYNNRIWEDWTPDGSFVKILADKRQTFVGQPVVIAWDSNDGPEEIQVWSSQTDDNGTPSFYTEQRKGAYLWHPPAPGNYAFAIRSRINVGTETSPTYQTEATHTSIQVLASPSADPVANIASSKATVNIGEVYTISWNASGGTPIIRSSPSNSTDTIDGVFSNESSQSIDFVQHAPGVYTYSIQVGGRYQQTTVQVVGELTAPRKP